MADITRVVSTGPSAQRVDVVFVAEGYQASERSKFLADVAIFSDYMFSVSSNMSRLNAPFSAFENYFNVSALFVASAQSGYNFGFLALFGAGVVLFLIAPLIQKLMHGVK